MAQNNTAGFDILIQISEAELNTQAAAAFAAGTLLAPEFVSPFSTGGASGTARLNLRAPVLDLDRPRPRIGVTVPFRDSQLEVTSPVALTVAPLDGTITIVDAATVRASGGTQQAVLDFTVGAPDVDVAFLPDTEARLAPLVAAAGTSMAAVRAQMAATVRQRLVADVQRLPLTPPIPVTAGNEDPLVVNGFDVGTVNDASAVDRDALVFGVRTSTATGGNVNLVTTSFVPAGSSSVLMFGNNWLLFRVIRPFLADALGVDRAAFDQPCTLNRSVPFQQGRLTSLRAFVQGNRIRVEGRATASGTGWSAVSNFSFFVDLALSGGNIVVTASTPQVNTSVSLEWWVWLLSLGLGALFGGIIGAIVAAIVTAIVTAIVEGVADNMIGSGISSATSGIPPIPLGPIGAGLTATSLLLDDMELRGSIVRRHGMPIRSSGTRELWPGFALDLDDGSVSSGTPPPYDVDLAWHPASGLAAGTGAGFQILGGSYESLTPTQLERFGYHLTTIVAGSIPVGLPFDLPFFPQPELVFGVLTNEGRFAKAGARRLASGQLRLRYTTFDRPVPRLDIGAAWEVTEEGAGTPGAGPQFQPCTRFDVARRGVLEALPRLLSFPVDYQWCLCGTVLAEGAGEVETPSGSVAYRLDGRRLELETSLGQPLECEVCVSAVDARGRELFTCAPIRLGRQEQRCGKPKRFIPNRIIDLIPCDPLLGLTQWESVASPAFAVRLERALGAKPGGSLADEFGAGPVK